METTHFMTADMSPSASNLPLVVITGPTASGKTTLAIELARCHGGEIICADSRTIYRDMDVGTAKPTAEERASVPHWGLDLAIPGERFTVAQFQYYAYTMIEAIRSRGHIPFLVGGTGLYIDAVLFNFTFAGGYDPKLREKLQQLSIAELREYCVNNNIPLPRNTQNKRYIIRNIEKTTIAAKPSSSQPLDRCIIVGITTDRRQLRVRIANRAEQLLLNNVVEEAIKLSKKYGWNNEAMTGNIYPLVKKYMVGELTLKDLKEQLIQSDLKLAKRQMTWLRRNPYVLWADLVEAEQYLLHFLDETQRL